MPCEDEHSHLHLHDDHVAPEPTSSAQLLNLKVSLFQLAALNCQNEIGDVRQLFKNSSTRFDLKPVVKSDADEQLILHIPFLNGSVKLHSIILRTNGDKYCPRNIKLWKNSRHIDFDNVNDVKPTFTVTNPHMGVPYNDGEDEIPDLVVSLADFVEHNLPRHIFTGVQVLTLFIENIYGDEDECHLHLIELRGEFTELSRDPVITLYELAANPADHQKIEEVHMLLTQF